MDAVTDAIHLQGFVRDVRYTACLASSLTTYAIDSFDINAAAPSGVLTFPAGQIAYSRWVSPKRTRSYPFERLYNTFNAPLRITIIPVIKDEGLDGDIDRIQYSTVSWMNLLNVYVVLAYYKDASKNRTAKRGAKQCLTGQKLDEVAVNEQIAEILAYKQSALHWNRTLFENRFADTYRQALSAYEQINQRSGVTVHPRIAQEKYLASVVADYQEFRNRSLRGSAGAAVRESGTMHRLEYLSDGAKAILAIENYLGGIYHLTADEIVFVDGTYILQESKNASGGALPSLSDIKDGLFKLILFSNLDELRHDGKVVTFQTRLKLTGRGVRSTVCLPCSPDILADFFAANGSVFNARQKNTIALLDQEASRNGLTVEIGGNVG